MLSLIIGGIICPGGEDVKTGTILMFGGNAAPTGYLLCDGSAVSRSTYGDLFNIIGTTFGAGNGTTTFNVPDFQDRLPAGVGVDVSLGAFGGNLGTLTGHNHSVSALDTEPTMTTVQVEAFTTTPVNVPTADHTHSIGSHETDDNAVPPYLGVRFIIKT